MRKDREHSRWLAAIARTLHLIALSAASVIILVPFLPSLVGLDVSSSVLASLFLISLGVYTTTIILEDRRSASLSRRRSGGVNSGWR